MTLKDNVTIIVNKRQSLTMTLKDNPSLFDIKRQSLTLTSVIDSQGNHLMSFPEDRHHLME